MESCKRSDCFACLYGRCLALWDTSGQDECRFYRTDLDMRRINRELSDMSSPKDKKGIIRADI